MMKQYTALLLTGLVSVAVSVAQTQPSTGNNVSVPAPVGVVPEVGTVLPPSQPKKVVQGDTKSEQADVMDTSPTVIKPGIPPVEMGGLYRIQVGAYTIVLNAAAAFDKVKSLGLNPVYQRNGVYFRVMLVNIKPEDVPSIAEKLGSVGFRTALIREEGETWDDVK
jgi:hypothetical protein